MMIRSGKMCKLCRTLFKTDEEIINHFAIEHDKLLIIKLEEFIEDRQYLDDVQLNTGGNTNGK